MKGTKRQSLRRGAASYAKPTRRPGTLDDKVKHKVRVAMAMPASKDTSQEKM